MSHKVKKIIKFILVSLLVIGLVGYVAFAMIQMSQPDPNVRCSAVKLVVQENPKAHFIDDNEVETMLLNSGLYPKGRLMSEVDTKKIEETIRKNDFIESVECYKTSDNKLCINIKQRTPIIYILPNRGEGYFVDVRGKRISKTNYAANLVVASGAIDEKFACNELKDIAVFINSDKFWNSQVEQIYVTKDKHNVPLIEIVPRVGKHIVKFGHIDDFESKFAHLKEFYEKALNSVGWNKYDTIDLRYNNQVICTKTKK